MGKTERCFFRCSVFPIHLLVKKPLLYLDAAGRQRSRTHHSYSFSISKRRCVSTCQRRAMISSAACRLPCPRSSAQVLRSWSICQRPCP